MSGLLITQSDQFRENNSVSSTLKMVDYLGIPIETMPWGEARPRILGANIPASTSFMILGIDQTQRRDTCLGWLKNDIRTSRSPLIANMPVLLWDLIGVLAPTGLDRRTFYAPVDGWKVLPFYPKIFLEVAKRMQLLPVVPNKQVV